jgi:hypothetical protein
MLEWVQWVLDQLQDDPDLSEMTGSPVDNPDRSQVGTSGPEFIDIDEIVGWMTLNSQCHQLDHRQVW